MQVELYLQGDNYNRLIIKEDGEIAVYARGRLHDLLRLLKDKSAENVLVVRGELGKYLPKITEDTKIRVVPLGVGINEFSVKLSEISLKPLGSDYYIVRMSGYVFRSQLAHLEASRAYAEDSELATAE